MRLVKGALAGLLILALGAMWMNRGWVVDAYRSDQAAASVRLSGVDLAYEPTEIPATPYRIPSAPDTRSTRRVASLGSSAATPLPSPSLTGGEAKLRGTVTGPEGPIPGAIVRIERHTDHGSISVDASTDEEGRWALGPLAGGRYRVRAWLPDLMTMGRSEVRFVADDEIATFDFSLWGIDPAPEFEFVDGGPMYEGFPATVALALTWRSIDAEGLVVINPLPGAEVTVETTAQVQVLGTQPLVTDGAGVARLQVRCVPTPTTSPGTDQPAGQSTGDQSSNQDDPTGQATSAAPASSAPSAALSSTARSSTAQDPTSPGPAGVLTARSGELSATFALPGCRPAPQPEPDQEQEPAPVDAGSEPSDTAASIDGQEPTDG